MEVAEPITRRRLAVVPGLVDALQGAEPLADQHRTLAVGLDPLQQDAAELPSVVDRQRTPVGDHADVGVGRLPVGLRPERLAHAPRGRRASPLLVATSRSSCCWRVHALHRHGVGPDHQTTRQVHHFEPVGALERRPGGSAPAGWIWSCRASSRPPKRDEVAAVRVGPGRTRAAAHVSRVRVVSGSACTITGASMTGSPWRSVTAPETPSPRLQAGRGSSRSSGRVLRPRRHRQGAAHQSKRDHHE